MSRKKGKEKIFEIKWKTDLPYRYSIGKLAVKFFEELKENKKIFGSKCPKCGKVNFPPRAVCAECFVEMTVSDMVELPPKGTLEGFTVVNYPFVDPQTGGMRPFPYGYGLFKLDGADTYTMHFVNETDYTKLKVGQRVEAVFKEEREGNMGDIPYFEVIKEEE
ncbi:MAG: Zn-ribbon domain-containing OB-fold protein [Promethearchaeota archaeon]